MVLALVKFQNYISNSISGRERERESACSCRAPLPAEARKDVVLLSRLANINNIMDERTSREFWLVLYLISTPSISKFFLYSSAAIDVVV